jgi:hypothetical protein
MMASYLLFSPSPHFRFAQWWQDRQALIALFPEKGVPILDTGFPKALFGLDASVLDVEIYRVNIIFTEISLTVSK